MKNRVFILTITAAMAGTMFTGCTWMDQQKENTQDNLKDAVNVVEARQVLNQAQTDSVELFKSLYVEKINTNEKRMAELKMKLNEQKKEDRAAYEKKLAVLEQKNTDLKKKLEDYKETGGDGWEKFKAEFNHDMNELGKAFSDLTVNNIK